MAETENNESQKETKTGYKKRMSRGNRRGKTSSEAKELLKNLENLPKHPLFCGEEETKKPEKEVYPGACRVCGGDIVLDYFLKFVSLFPPIIGPGSRNQYQYVPGDFHCKTCGVKYQFIPGQEVGKGQEKE